MRFSNSLFSNWPQSLCRSSRPSSPINMNSFGATLAEKIHARWAGKRSLGFLLCFPADQDNPKDCQDYSNYFQDYPKRFQLNRRNPGVTARTSSSPWSFSPREQNREQSTWFQDLIGCVLATPCSLVSRTDRYSNDRTNSFNKKWSNNFLQT